MTKSRASIFDATPDVDISGFMPKKSPDTKAPAQEQVRAVAEAAHFPSRQAPTAPSRAPEKQEKRAARIYRTGRNVQLNVKGSREVLEAFYAITEDQGWVLGYTLERAVAALQRELDAAT